MSKSAPKANKKTPSNEGQEGNKKPKSDSSRSTTRAPSFDDERGYLLITRYDSHRVADCFTAAANNNVQNGHFTPQLVRCSNPFALNYENENPEELPEADTLFSLYMRLDFIGGPSSHETEVACFTPIDLHFDANGERVADPNLAVTTIEENTQIYHTLNCARTSEREEKFDQMIIDWVSILPLRFYIMFLLLTLSLWMLNLSPSYSIRHLFASLPTRVNLMESHTFLAFTDAMVVFTSLVVNANAAFLDAKTKTASGIYCTPIVEECL